MRQEEEVSKCRRRSVPLQLQRIVPKNGQFCTVIYESVAFCTLTSPDSALRFDSSSRLPQHKRILGRPPFSEEQRIAHRTSRLDMLRIALSRVSNNVTSRFKAGSRGGFGVIAQNYGGGRINCNGANMQTRQGQINLLLLRSEFLTVC